MLQEKLESLVSNNNLVLPEINGEIPHGDMPGDKVEIGEDHIAKANTVIKALVPMMAEQAKAEGKKKIVIAVCGGSGVGKSETASLLSYYFNQNGIGSYTMSGDNYPRRIPMYNDAERLRIYRYEGLQQMLKDGVYTEERFAQLREWQKANEDADKNHVEENAWMESYVKGGRKGLEEYLGTPNETNFAEVEGILSQFKAGKDKIYLKRMGREETELWYSEIDFSEIEVLIIEWTHGNSDYFDGVDFPVLLNSTPEETLAHRRARNRDGAVDSGFTTTVLEIEQELLKKQAHKAKVIVSKQNELLDWDSFKKLMNV
jgi:alpha-galactosidase